MWAYKIKNYSKPTLCLILHIRKTVLDTFNSKLETPKNDKNEVKYSRIDIVPFVFLSVDSNAAAIKGGGFIPEIFENI